MTVPVSWNRRDDEVAVITRNTHDLPLLEFTLTALRACSALWWREHPSERQKCSFASGDGFSMPFIPGLTSHSFQAVSPHSVPTTPELVSSRVEDHGSFDFVWKANGSKEYILSASGNLTGRQKCLKVSCRCPSFAHQPMDDVPKVCKHLFAALTSVIDASASHHASATVFVVPGRGPPASAEPATAASAKQPRNEVINLVDSDAEEEGITTKRSFQEKSDFPRKKQARVVEAPIKLFCTVQDAALRQQHDRNHWSWTQCRTLRQMILGDEPIQWLAISNFLVDFDFLLDELPELVSIPRVVVFYGQESDPSAWRRACGPSVDFVLLDPKKERESAQNTLRYQFRSGTHHSKFFLVGRVDSVRVIIHTANLLHCDIHSKAQAAYIEDFPVGDTGSEFEDTLVNYMDSYGYTRQQTWLEGHSEPLTRCLRRYDFSAANAVLIPSVPGYHKLNAEHRMGHLKVKQAVARYTPENSTVRPIICQFSSLGASISENFLRQLQASMDTGLARRPFDPNDKSTVLRLQFVYPTMKEICNSIEGMAGGGSVPVKLKNISKPFIQPLLRKWSSSTKYNPWATPRQNPLQKPHNVPHIKTFYQVSETRDSMDWLVLASHNMSTQAWGRIQNSKYDSSGKTLYIESWELGVFVSPAVLGVNKLVYWSDGDAQPGTATVPMPYKMYLPDVYGAEDRPWATDSLCGTM